MEFHGISWGGGGGGSVRLIGISGEVGEVLIFSGICNVTQVSPFSFAFLTEDSKLVYILIHLQFYKIKLIHLCLTVKYSLTWYLVTVLHLGLHKKK